MVAWLQYRASPSAETDFNQIARQMDNFGIMTGTYSQFTAAMAIARASLVSMLRSPTAVVFSILFPVIFIVVFGTMRENTSLQMKVAVARGCDTVNLVYQLLRSVPVIELQTNWSRAQMEEELSKGRITAIMDLQNDSKGIPVPHYNVSLLTSNAASNKFAFLQSTIEQAINHLNAGIFPKNFSAGKVTVKRTQGRVYHQIDFILPGQLGFSLLMAGVFSSAFLFFNLRQSFVLKRIFATPVKRGYLIMGELTSRMMFQVIGFVVMISLGYFAFDFTLVNGLATFFEMLSLSIFGLLIFMGTGFIISSFINDEGSLSPVANTFTLPQILLCGLFFPIGNYPVWLQSVCKVLPLTILVDGFRQLAFEGVRLWQMPVILLELLGWTIFTGLLTVKLFRWE